MVSLLVFIEIAQLKWYSIYSTHSGAIDANIKCFSASGGADGNHARLGLVRRSDNEDDARILQNSDIIGNENRITVVNDSNKYENWRSREAARKLKQRIRMY